MNVSLWRSWALWHMDRETAKLLLLLQREWYEQWGNWPTVDQLLLKIRGG